MRAQRLAPRQAFLAIPGHPAGDDRVESHCNAAATGRGQCSSEASELAVADVTVERQPHPAVPSAARPPGGRSALPEQPAYGVVLELLVLGVPERRDQMAGRHVAHPTAAVVERPAGRRDRPQTAIV